MYQDILRDIRTQCRLKMNGMASTSMRERGLNYKINFGLMASQIKEIAAGCTPDAALAQTLWKEDTRELKILATLLYPSSEFGIEDATQWVNEIPNQEIREQVCLNLFQELAFAQSIATDWANAKDKDIRITGYWLLARLFLTKKIEGRLLLDCFTYVFDDISDDSLFLRNAALLVLKHIGRQSKGTADTILSQMEEWKENQNATKREAYNNLAFEFEFFFDN